MHPSSGVEVTAAVAKKLEEELSGVELYVIDEYSFLSHHLFMCVASRLAVAFPSVIADIFGDVNILFLGDPLQIPPVKALALWEEPDKQVQGNAPGLCSLHAAIHQGLSSARVLSAGQ